MAVSGLPKRLLTHTINIERRTADGNVFVYRPFKSGIKCNIQPVSEQEDPQEGETLASSFYCYLNLDRSLLVTDRVHDTDNNIVYTVQGIEHHDYATRLRHTKLKMTSEKRA